MQHLETNDFATVIMDAPKQVTEDGIVVTETDAILENEMHRYATVHAAPETYTVTRNRDGKKIEIRTPSPVKAGDRVLISKYGGVGNYKLEDGTLVTVVRMHEILGIVEN